MIIDQTYPEKRVHSNLGVVYMRVLLGIIGFLFVPGVSSAATTTYECSYPRYATRDGIKTELLTLTFIYDGNTKKAYMRGNVGVAEVTTIFNRDGGITFIEITNSGNVMTTVIAPNKESVHSRNGIFSGKILPSQYYGKCKASN